MRNMNLEETAVDFRCSGSQLIGVIHRSAGSSVRGVVMLARNRCGPHRWYVLQARQLAQAGFPVMRFSPRGEGESEGTTSTAGNVQQDLVAAIAEFCRREPGMKEVVLWGLCTSARDVLLYAPTDVRVAGVVLVNPSVNDDGAAALAAMRRLRTRVKTLTFWRYQMSRSNVDLVSALGRTGRRVRTALQLRIFSGKRDTPADLDPLAGAFRSYPGRVFLILSGRDPEATTTRSVLVTPSWRRSSAATPITIREHPDADHLFSRRAWSDRATAWTLEWMCSWQ